MKRQGNVRWSALELLEKIEGNQAYSNLLLNDTIKHKNIASRDIPLLTELVYGTIQRKMTLDFFLEPFLKSNKKLQSWVRQLLRMTVYQLVYLDKIPDHAAIYEAVEIAKNKGHKGIASLVNGVLRAIQRQGLPSFDTIKDPLKRLSIETSYPLWLVERWTEQWGFEKTKQMCEINLCAPTQTARVNTTKLSKEQCLRLLTEEGFQVEESAVIPEAIKCLKGNLANSKAFEKGFLTIQDESSMLVSYALAIEEGNIVLDACAAPGGKSTHIAEKLNNQGQVLSLDLHEHKVKLIMQNAKRLGLTNITAKTMDARCAINHFSKESFDRILLDAPCSGLGVMRRKPDMKYTKKEEDIESLSKIQMQLLESVAPLLKKGGILVYSTCTVDKHENEYVVQSFLQNHNDFIGDITLKERLPEMVQQLVDRYQLQIFPQDFNSDGFYFASIRKKV